MGNKELKISVALCSYNGEKYILEQLKSIAAQSRLPNEIVICDDNSTDKTAKIVDSFSAHAPFPIHFFENRKNLGSTKNFEKAISLCNGDIIVLADQDDFWKPKKIAEIMSIFESEPEVGAVFTDADVVDESLQPLGYSLWETRDFDRTDQTYVKKKKDILPLIFKHHDNLVTGATMAFRSDYRKLILPIDLDWVHDGWIALLIAAVSDIDIVQEPLIKYRQHPNQQIGAKHLNFKSKLSRAIKVDRNGYGNQLQKYRSAYNRLISYVNNYHEHDKMKLILHKIAHAKVRANMPASKVKRLPVVIKELFGLRYHNCSNGLKSALRDMLFLFLGFISIGYKL